MSDIQIIDVVVPGEIEVVEVQVPGPIATIDVLTGVPGPQGSIGVNGRSAYELAVDAGYVGSQEEWLASLVGPQGPTGAAGADGVDGTNGLDGADGVDGADGASAYEVAVAAGFVGTEAAWLASLKGDKGDKGDQGDPGLNLVSSVAGRIGDVVLTASDVGGLHAVATSGSYTDLTSKPTIPSANSQLTNDSGYITSSALTPYALQATVDDLDGGSF